MSLSRLIGPRIADAAGSRCRRAITLLDALLAMIVLSIVVLALTYATTAGHQHLQHGDTSLRAVRLAEHLLEEIESRPYHDSGGTSRDTWHIDDYDGFEEEPGELADFAGEKYGSTEQVFTRTVTVDDDSETIADLDGITIEGKRVTVTVAHPAGEQWQLTRFIAVPLLP